MSRVSEDSADEQHYRDGFYLVRDGLRLHYRDYRGSADKPPLLCLPGLTRNARDFAAFAELHSPMYRVLALDFRGRGESEYDPAPVRYNPLTYATDVLEFLDELSIPQAIFVGTSLGGLVTMTVATIAPDRIAAAILNDVGPELNRAGLDRIQSYVGKGERFQSWDAAAAAIAASQGSAFPTYRPADWLAMARRNCREQSGAIVFDYDMAIADAFKLPTPQFDMWPLFRALARKPLLVIRGAKSDLLNAESAERMKAAAPEMKLAVVPGVGHAPELN
ncbi:MAG TPA: alpha/beta hydrolase, partial [Sphingomicrobium sp.]|nr:alpha/beta hydrolase [Sphingomicrobium sp.]